MEIFEASKPPQKPRKRQECVQISVIESDNVNIETELNYLWSQPCTIQKPLYDVRVWLTAIECFGRFGYTMASVVAESKHSRHYESAMN